VHRDDESAVPVALQRLAAFEISGGRSQDRTMALAIFPFFNEPSEQTNVTFTLSRNLAFGTGSPFGIEIARSKNGGV
jgi:hypothetical protein